MRILNAVEDVNNLQKEILFHKVNAHFENNLKGKKFAMWGLSFKPKTDDMREAPSLVIIEKLLEAGATVCAYDPVAVHEAKRMLGDKIFYSDDMYQTLNGADALLIVTEWAEFRSPDFEIIKSKLKHQAIFDGRNIFDHRDMRNMGFEYYCIGIGNH